VNDQDNPEKQRFSYDWYSLNGLQWHQSDKVFNTEEELIDHVGLDNPYVRIRKVR
jgi:hypothetical protein